MKNVYSLALAGICFLTGMNAHGQALDYTMANYTPSRMGNLMPNNYANVREKTSYAFTNNDPATKLLAPVNMIDLFAGEGNGTVDLTWRTGYEPDLKRYEIEYSKDNITYQQVGVVTAGAYLNGKAYTFRHSPVNVRDRIFYRIKMVDKSGRYDYTPVLSLQIAGTSANHIFPTVVNSGVVSLDLNEPFETAQIIDMQGRILQTFNLNGRTGRTDITLSKAARGVCLLRILGMEQVNQPRKSIVQKMIFIQ